jgi:hypothetical protein
MNADTILGRYTPFSLNSKIPLARKRRWKRRRRKMASRKRWRVSLKRGRS